MNSLAFTPPAHWSQANYTPWSPQGGGSRALVLAGGGAAGIAWESGVILGLQDAGVDLTTADTMIGTSAGSVVAAHLRLGGTIDTHVERITNAPRLTGMGRLGLLDAVRYTASLMTPHASYGRAMLGRAAIRARTMTESEWIEMVAGTVIGSPWPQERLLITAVDAVTGTSVVFDRASGVPLERAIAASCTVPGVFPPVTINGRQYIDGGMRSIGNADLAAGHATVVALAPFPFTPKPRQWPARQLAALGARTMLIAPDRRSRAAMGLNPLDTRRTAATFAAARQQGGALAGSVGDLWQE